MPRELTISSLSSLGKRETYSMAKDRLMRALHGEHVAQIPWLPHIGTHAAQLLDVSAQRYLQEADLLARGALLCADRYRCDGIPLLDDPTMEAIALGCTPHWSEQGLPSLVSAPLSRLAPEQLVEHLPSLPSETTGRWPTVIAAGAQAKSELERRDVALVGIAAGPATIAYQLRGMTLFADLFRRPECATQLFTYAGQVSAISARIYAEIIGCDIVAINDTPATMLQPAYFRQYVLPNVQKAWQVIHRAGKTSSFWA
jgi:uroporphyrinogen decarboxylase